MIHNGTLPQNINAIVKHVQDVQHLRKVFMKTARVEAIKYDEVSKTFGFYAVHGSGIKIGHIYFYLGLC